MDPEAAKHISSAHPDRRLRFRGACRSNAASSCRAAVTVIDNRNYNLFQPLLYQVATAALSPAGICSSYSQLLRGQANTRVLLDEVISVDRAAHKAHTGSGGELGYDILIIATGSEYNYFGHEQWPRLAPGLKSIEDAQA